MLAELYEKIETIRQASPEVEKVINYFLMKKKKIKNGQQQNLDKLTFKFIFGTDPYKVPIPINILGTILIIVLVDSKKLQGRKTKSTCQGNHDLAVGSRLVRRRRIRIRRRLVLVDGGGVRGVGSQKFGVLGGVGGGEEGRGFGASEEEEEEIGVRGGDEL